MCISKHCHLERVLHMQVAAWSNAEEPSCHSLTAHIASLSKRREAAGILRGPQHPKTAQASPPAAAPCLQPPAACSIEARHGNGRRFVCGFKVRRPAEPLRWCGPTVAEKVRFRQRRSCSLHPRRPPCPHPPATPACQRHATRAPARARSRPGRRGSRL